MANRTNILIIVLVLVIVVLAGIMVYAFVIKPSISGYNVQRQSEGVELTYNFIMQRAAACQPTTYNYNNRTVTLIALECYQQGQQ